MTGRKEFRDTDMIKSAFSVTCNSKKTFFPLEKCFDFNVKDRSLFELLTVDPAYLHAVILGAQTYIDLASGILKQDGATQRSSIHLLKTIQLLRRRLSDETELKRISNPTFTMVITLANIAHLTGDHVTAVHHLEGLWKMVNLRGGVSTFRESPKLLTELFR
jgi:hypothetical protein